MLQMPPISTRYTQMADNNMPEIYAIGCSGGLDFDRGVVVMTSFVPKKDQGYKACRTICIK